MPPARIGACRRMSGGVRVVSYPVASYRCRLRGASDRPRARRAEATILQLYDATRYDISVRGTFAWVSWDKRDPSLARRSYVRSCNMAGGLSPCLDDAQR